MKILIVGSGGREHALGEKLNKKGRRLFFAPGNAGTSLIGENIDIDPTDIDKLLDFAKKSSIDFTLVGPENPISLGIADVFEENGLEIFAPIKKAAKLEYDKDYTKNFLEKYGVKTASFKKISNREDAISLAKKYLEEDSRVILKRNGLCGGKGVYIAASYNQAVTIIDQILAIDDFLLVEKYLEGFEMSLLTLTDTKTIIPLPPSRDYKKAYENNLGPNTGGMGAYAPCEMASPYIKEIKEEILPKILRGFKSEGIDYRGALYIGFMICESGIYVLEFNVRFGDPESQVVFELIENDLLDMLIKTSKSRLDQIKLRINDKKAICLVLTSKGYPGAYETDKKIRIKDGIRSKIYHAGSKTKKSCIYTAGGRVLNLVTSAPSFDNAIDLVYKDLSKINFLGMTYRSDIGPRVKRVYVSKKDRVDVASKILKEDIEKNLGLSPTRVKIYNRYDLEIRDSDLDKLFYTLLAEAPLDDLYAYDKAYDLEKSFKKALVKESLAGQFNQREQALLDTARLIDPDMDIKVSYAKVFEMDGISDEDIGKIEAYLINKVDSKRGKLLDIPQSLGYVKIDNPENIIYKGFINFTKDDLENFIKTNSLAMSLDDLILVRDYYKNKGRDPFETEIKIIDTYWSDHCRHTSFNTILDIKLNPKTNLDRAIKNSLDKYIKMRNTLTNKKPLSLMSLATDLKEYLKDQGYLPDLEVSKEVNASSIHVKVRIGDKKTESIEDYLIMFKNETHNHPTEIEPFGGAATCLGGAIRDPLSARAYVYQAMRLTGSSDLKKPYEKTIKGKLPAAEIAKKAALGFSSYGNQIGISTGLVDEFYHEGFRAKRLECGAVIGAVRSKDVVRLDPKPGDIVILLGGKTGRDGIGGATGSSKSHTINSLRDDYAQVQKGNAPEERKIQRLFRKGKVTSLIKKCNDFGAGGVAVAIGELAGGIDIYLDRVPLKYKGLRPCDIAISESQERMAVLIDKKDKDKFIKYAKEENLEASHVADVTDTKLMRMYYKDLLVAEISYDLLNTNGAKRFQEVDLSSEHIPDILKKCDDDPHKFYEKISSLDLASKKNLIELFDSSIGAGTVLAPLGGSKLLNPSQVMGARIPVKNGVSKTVSIISYGYDPRLSEASQYLAGYYAVVESVAKLVAVCANYQNIKLSFQEFYEKMKEGENFSKPIKSLLGAFETSHFLKIAPISGKDSMSGTFHDINVPPSLISFAITTVDIENIISNDLKGKGRLGLIKTPIKEDGTLDLDILIRNFKNLEKDIKNGNIISAIALTRKGMLADIYEQAVGNTGFDIKYHNLYSPMYGSFVVEYKNDRDFIDNIGKFSDNIIVNSIKMDKDILYKTYIHSLDDIYKGYKLSPYEKLHPKKIKRRLKSKKPVEKVGVAILAAPGTNCEIDSKLAFEKQGAKAEIFVFKNQTKADIEKSIKKLAILIKKSQIFMIPGGFSLADEPEGSGKFLANLLRNKDIKEAITHLLEENDGLVIGVCNGFQALVKSSYLPFAKAKIQKEDDISLTFNESSRHIASFVDTKILTANTPFSRGLDTNIRYRIPISHGEGRFVANKQAIEQLLENDQIYSVYENSKNGSAFNIEGIISKDGKILGRMGHVERVDDNLYKNVYNVKADPMFYMAVNYFKKDE